ncbi:MAG: hypothetical protein WAT39_18715 [Planctomycetota bacterium]
MRPFLSATFLLVPLALALPGTAQTVQLADGRVLLAEVEAGSATGEGMRVKRLDNGGTLDLRWEHLSPASALAWKRKFDLVGDEQEEITVPANVVDYVVNGVKQSLIGRYAQEGDHIVVTVKGVPYKIPRSDLRSVRNIQAPVANVLTREEFRTELQTSVKPGSDADKHMVIADQLMRARDYDGAGEALQEAKKLGNSKSPQQLDTMLAKVQRFKDAKKELDALDEIRVTRNRGDTVNFEKGTRLIAQFEKDFPQTRLKAEFDSEVRRFKEARNRHYTIQVAEQWRRSVALVAEKAVADGSLTLEAAKDYATNKMTDDIVTRLVTVLKLDATEIKQLWGQRKDNPVGKRTETFSYGVGSWVLGAEAILKSTATGKDLDKQNKDKAGSAGNAQDNAFQKALKQALEKRRLAMQNQGQGGQQQQTDEDWWREAERVERISWLRAYYAEFGGQLVVTFATVSPCISCYGEGTVPEIGGDGKMIRNKCFLCQGTKWLRSFRAF